MNRIAILRLRLAALTLALGVVNAAMRQRKVPGLPLAVVRGDSVIMAKG